MNKQALSILLLLASLPLGMCPSDVRADGPATRPTPLVDAAQLDDAALNDLWDPAHPGPNGEELQGQYAFDFNYDAAQDWWVLETDSHSPKDTSTGSRPTRPAGP